MNRGLIQHLGVALAALGLGLRSNPRKSATKGEESESIPLAKHYKSSLGLNP